jgi:anhydro-N-acetylmuramic acid kinase
VTAYAGLMSGTSLDGVDGVLVEFEPMQVLAHVHRPFDPGLRDELLALNRRGDDELHRAALASNAVADAYAGVLSELLAQTGVEAARVRAVGAHGQTVRHRPHEFDGTGYTLQLLNAALLAERIGIDVVADLRSRDVAAGGQGAPLVPAFHQALFARAGQTTGVLNLGGIANLTLLRGDGCVLGFDCGPANVLMDAWCRRHRGASFDVGGAWAAGGRVVPALLTQMLHEPYFGRRPPKSTGRDLFDADWLAAQLARHGGALPEQDVQTTLCELTARGAADALLRHGGDASALLVCGGGAHNAELTRRLAAALPNVAVQPTDAFGLPATQVEAVAFAWLARAFVERRPGNLASVTGAAGPRVLGALHPGR